MGKTKNTFNLKMSSISKTLSLALFALAVKGTVRSTFNLSDDATLNDLEQNGLYMRQGSVVHFRIDENGSTGLTYDEYDNCDGKVDITHEFISSCTDGAVGCGGYMDYTLTAGDAQASCVFDLSYGSETPMQITLTVSSVDPMTPTECVNCKAMNYVGCN